MEICTPVRECTSPVAVGSVQWFVTQLGATEMIRELIEKCRRLQQEHERRIPVQLEIPALGSVEGFDDWADDVVAALRGEILWATEEEAMQEWRDRTFHSTMRPGADHA
jgi:hypothetical protein